MMVYADNAATTKMSKTAISAMTAYFENVYANPSSLHTAGQNARLICITLAGCGTVSDGQGQGVTLGGSDDLLAGGCLDGMTMQAQIQVSSHAGLVGQVYIGI